MDPQTVSNIVFAMRQDQNSNDPNVANYRSLNDQLCSSNQSVPALIPLLDQTDNIEIKSYILGVVRKRVKYHLDEFGDEELSNLFFFFLRNFTIDKVRSLLSNDPNSFSALKRLATIQASIVCKIFPEMNGLPNINIWEIILQFLPQHFHLFIASFYKLARLPSFNTLTHFYTMRVQMAPIDQVIYENVQKPFVSEGQSPLSLTCALKALGGYTRWGMFNQDPWYQNLEISGSLRNLFMQNPNELLNLLVPTFLRLGKGGVQLLSGSHPLDPSGIIQQVSTSQNLPDAACKLISVIIQNLHSSQESTKFIEPMWNIFQQNHNLTQILAPAVAQIILQYPSAAEASVFNIITKLKSLLSNLQNIDEKIDKNVRIVCFLYTIAYLLMMSTNQNPPLNIINQFFSSGNPVNDPSLASVVFALFSYCPLIDFSFKIEFFKRIGIQFYQNISYQTPDQYYRTYYLLKALTLSVFNQDPALISELINSLMMQMPPIAQNNELLNIFNTIISKHRSFIDPQNSQNLIQQLFPQNNQICQKLVGLLITEGLMNILPELINECGNQFGNSNEKRSIVIKATSILSHITIKLTPQISQPVIQILEGFSSFVDEQAQQQDDELLALYTRSYIPLVELNLQNSMSLLDHILPMMCGVSSYTAAINLLTKIIEILSSSNNFVNENFSKYIGYANQMQQVVIGSYHYPNNASDCKILNKLVEAYSLLMNQIISVLIKNGQFNNIFPNFVNHLGNAFTTFYNLSHAFPYLIQIFLPLLSNNIFPVPAFIDTFFIQSMSFIFDPNFYPELYDYQPLIQSVLKLHTYFYKLEPDKTNAKFMELLSLINMPFNDSFLQNYSTILNNGDTNNFSHIHNPFFIQFYNNILIYRNACTWFPPQQSS